MSTRYIIPGSTQVKNTLKQILINNSFDDSELMNILHKLGCLVNVFYISDVFSATDCHDTASSLWSFFDPSNVNMYNKVTTDSLSALLSDYNVFHFKVMGKLFSYHTFIAIKYHQTWYILQAYANLYEMTVTQVDSFSDDIVKMLALDSMKIYNDLFRDTISEVPNKVTINLKAGFFAEGLTQKLKTQLEASL